MLDNAFDRLYNKHNYKRYDGNRRIVVDIES